ncbi:MAG: ABC transporter substrate-binding protein, partial [Kiloniellaceae bacterium]
ERGTAVMEKLINQDNVAAVGGGYHSSVGIASKEVAHDNGVPVVFAETWNDKITASKLPEIFRIAPLSSEASAVYYNFAATIPGVKKVVIVTENTDYGIPAAQETEAGLTKSGISSVTFSVDIGTQDFSGIIQRVKAENPDMIITLTTGEASLNFAQQAAENGVGPGDLPFLCDQISLESKLFWTNVPDGNYCFMSRVGLPPEHYTDISKSFLKRYVERTGKAVPESYAFEAYDSIMIIAQAITAANSTKGADIIAALEKIDYNGALGKITFPYGINNPPAANGKGDQWWHQFPDPAITVVQYQTEGQDSTEAPVVYPDRYKTGEPVFPK